MRAKAQYAVDMKRRPGHLALLAPFAIFLTAMAVTCGACGGVSSDDGAGAGTPFIGHWSYYNAELHATVSFTISRSENGYLVEVPMLGEEQISYALRHGRLVPVEVGDYAEFSLAGDRVVMTVPSPSPGAGAERVTVSPAPASNQSSLSPDEGNVILGVHKIQVGLMSWAVDHGTVFPAPALVAAGTEFATRYVQHWPVDPFTGLPMKQGTAPGDFAYSADGSSYGLTGYGSNAQPLVTVP